MEFLIDTFRHYRLKDCEIRFPKELIDLWEERSLKGYRMVARQFLPLAIEISNRYYPNSYIDDTNIDNIIEKHFAFKIRNMAKS